MRTVEFEYCGVAQPRLCRQGAATRLEGGLHVKMWGGERVYWLSYTTAKTGAFTAVLVASAADAPDIPVTKWDTMFEPTTQGGREARMAYVRKVCQEAAEIVGRGVDAPGRQAIESLFKDYFDGRLDT